METLGNIFDLSKANVFFALVVFSALVLYMIRVAKSGVNMYIRPLAGLNSIRLVLKKSLRKIKSRM